MSSYQPHWFAKPTFAAMRRGVCVIPVGLILALTCQPASGQIGLPNFQEQAPLAKVGVQKIALPQIPMTMDPNLLMIGQQEEEDPLSFYVRTRDGEWKIPTQVNKKDPWVRLLLLGPGEPTVVDVAIEINQQPFRAAREEWIDRLIFEAKSTFLIRTGAATAAAIVETTAKGMKEQLAATAEENAGSETDSETDGENEDEEEVPMVTAQARQSRSLFRRLINYLAADRSTADREEVRWLLAEWTGGPALLTLSPAFAWRRAEVAPLWTALDTDGDQILSQEEIAEAGATLKQADSNHDDITDLAELQRFGKDRDKRRRSNAYPLIIVVDDQTDWKQLEKYLHSAYPQPGQRIRSLFSAGLPSFLSLQADMVYRVSFTDKEAEAGLLAVSSEKIGSVESNSVGIPASEAWQFLGSTEQVITVERSTTYLEFSAAQGKVDSGNAGGDMKQTQVAIGAVADGFPLMRLLDTDDNRQLTQREQKHLAQLLETIDRNQDQRITRNELPTAIRLVVTHGPQAHEQLARPVAAQRKYGEPTELEAPGWFVGMDRNRDGDLSQREFQGSPTQFRKYDKDGDGLISQQEAQPE